MTQLTLLPSNATELEQALGTLTKRISQLPVPLNTLYSAEHCPEDLLPWLAWSYSVDYWDTSWDINTQRQVIADSIQQHAIKGTKAAVVGALQSFGIESRLSEWWETNSPPYTFTVDLWGKADGTPFSPQDYALAYTNIDAKKPLRAHYHLRIACENHNVLSCAIGITLTSQLRLNGNMTSTTPSFVLKIKSLVGITMTQTG